MEAKKYLKAIFIISLIGVLFSGYLSYIEITTETCKLESSCSSFLMMPACVYGLVMYFIIMLISLIGIKKD